MSAHAVEKLWRQASHRTVKTASAVGGGREVSLIAKPAPVILLTQNPGREGKD